MAKKEKAQEIQRDERGEVGIAGRCWGRRPVKRPANNKHAKKDKHKPSLESCWRVLIGNK